MAVSFLKETQKPNKIQVIINFGACLILGVLLGTISKFSDTVSSNGLNGMLFSYVSDITTSLGVWVFFATLIAVWSRSPIYAGIKVFLFFGGMFLAYYTYSQMLFGFFPTYYFLRWGVVALFSPIAGYIAWYGRGEGWVAAFCAALPIGLLLSQGYPFFYLFSVVFVFDILAATILFIVLPRTKYQKLKVITVSLLISYSLVNSDILLYIFGGL
ncbi:DUF6518 family protein [Aquibacillus kalidii]|uniref:DUF6518 family protein n=1 Tax=Aquibacillus kalidii TaxID=2762597 RepID=UPI001644F811|nr:DUF6518 family protein [Aquibacillus kalidii]